MIFEDRRDAGRQLAAALSQYAGRPEVLVLGLPRGGVPVAFEVASALKAPLDVFVVRKIGVPGHEELALGAIASGGALVFNEELARALDLPQEAIRRLVRAEATELARREAAYREGRPPLDVRGRTVLLVDDGLATGASMRAAIAALAAAGPAWVVVAVPIASPDTCAELRADVDDIICAAAPEPFHAVGAWYQDFSPTSDDEVRALLAAASGRPAQPARASRASTVT
jgi:predicted phosphoribosyltransferase